MRTITTDRPVEAVYAYFLHPDEYVAPNAPDIESVERSPQGPRKRKVVPGAVVDSRIGPFLCPPHELRFEGVVGPLRPRCRFTFASVGEGTELRLEATPCSPRSRHASGEASGRSGSPGPRRFWSPRRETADRAARPHLGLLAFLRLREFIPGSESVLHGEDRSRCACGDADLGVGVLNVPIGGLHRDTERGLTVTHRIIPQPSNLKRRLRRS